ncbi:MAG: disulfide bond formation protein B, partial [Rhodospirillaceae bacterium]
GEKLGLPPSRAVGLGICVLSIAILLTAVAMEHGLGLAPCILCLYQRGPWVATVVLGGVAFLPGLPPGLRRALLGACALSFFGNSALAFYHVGVEQLWWEGTAACGGAPPASASGAPSLADIRSALSQPDTTPRCDEPQWDLFGITMAGYNMILCFGLGVITTMVVAKSPFWRRA